MSRNATPSQETFIDLLRESMGKALQTPDGVAEPAALLWTDADGQWRPLVQTLQAALPQLYVLGPYDPANRTGPVIWLRCIVDRTLPDAAPPEGVAPILYLPGVPRQRLRAGGECPAELQPLIELQYRGAVWRQRNGRDWTVEAFLTSKDALGLDVAADLRTREALVRALPLLAEEPVAALSGRRLEADDFDRLAVVDPIRDILTWMDDDETFRSGCDAARWESFRSVCEREYGFDPETCGPTQAGGNLLDAEGAWEQVWQRFCEAPTRYPSLPQVLRNARSGDLLSDPARQPARNDDEEAALRSALEELENLPHAEACKRVLDLEKIHAPRREWVWAQLGESPLAQLLGPLARVAACARNPLGGDAVETIASAYAAEGWRCDAAAMDALARAGSADAKLVRGVLRAVYQPWLDASARHFQDAAVAQPQTFSKGAAGVLSEAEICILFVDGLRFDVAGRLEEQLESRQFRVRLSHRLAPVPTVTATAKPLASPAHSACEETAKYGQDLTPAIGELQKASNAQRLRDEMARQGIEVIEGDELLFPSGAQQGGWTEIGRLDSLGHKLNSGLAEHIATELEEIAQRVADLLDAGWTRVRIVTDHGWLLLPGGLPKVELPTYLTQTKWARCAVVQGQMPEGFPVFPWHWNPHVQIVSPPGIGSFFAGNDYAHGGVSPQECVVPEMVVERGVEAIRARIEDIRWRGMRCRVDVDTNASGVQVDLRLRPRDQDSSIVVSAKEAVENGQVSLAVADDRHEGAEAHIVLLDGAGQVLDQRSTRVGEE